MKGLSLLFRIYITNTYKNFFLFLRFSTTGFIVMILKILSFTPFYASQENLYCLAFIPVVTYIDALSYKKSHV